MANSKLCYKCNSECVFKEDKQRLFGFPCDVCCRVICQECNKTQAQEVRVIPSQSRTLIHMCPECLKDFQQLPKKLKQLESYKTELDTLRDKIGKMEATIIKSGIDNRVKSLEMEMKSLKNTEITKSGNKMTSPNESTSVNQEIYHDFKDHLRNQQEQIALKLDSVVDAIKNTNVELVKTFLSKNEELVKTAQSKDNTNPRVFTQSQVSQAINDSLTHINLVTRNKSSKAPSNVISGKNTNSFNITAAKSCKWFYVGNLSSECTVDLLKSHLVDIGLSPMSCEKLKSKQDHKSSFKIAIPTEQESMILNSNEWPMDVIVKPFVFKPDRQYNSTGPRNFHRGYQNRTLRR